MKKFRVIDLFSGAGGLTFGFYYNLIDGKFVKRDNVEFVFSNEFAPQAVRAFKKNYGDNIPVISGDICNISDEVINQYVGEKEVDVIIGGPPCQSFSTVGQRKYDDRAKLSNEYLRILEKVKPKMFLFENVKGILTEEKIPSSKEEKTEECTEVAEESVTKPEEDTVECIDEGDHSLAEYKPQIGGQPNPFENDTPTEIDDRPVEDYIGEGEDRPGEGKHF